MCLLSLIVGVAVVVESRYGRPVNSHSMNDIRYFQQVMMPVGSYSNSISVHPAVLIIHIPWSEINGFLIKIRITWIYSSGVYKHHDFKLELRLAGGNGVID